MQRIGPNAVIQTLGAVEALEGREAMEQLAQAVPERAPVGMVPEDWFIELVTALRASLPPDRAEAALAESGHRTAQYVAGHRIPAPVRTLLRWLPPRLAVPLLLKAFARHAWTFAGSGRFGVEGDFPGTITLEHAPTCRHAMGRHAGTYYEAAFEGLLSLAAPGVRVREVDCASRGADRCRFAIMLS